MLPTEELTYISHEPKNRQVRVVNCIPHRRSKESWLNRRLRSFFLSKSFKDVELNETVFTERTWKEMEAELNEKFPQDSHKKLTFGQVLCDGRGQGGFQH